MEETAGAFFTTYEGVKYTLGNLSYSRYTLPTPIIHATASSVAEMVTCLMITPAEVLKQNAQVIHNQSRNQGRGHGRGRGRGSVFLSVASRFRHKPWNLWSGYTALVGRNLPFTGLHFPLFEYVRSHLVAWWWRQEHNKRKDTSRVAIRAVLTGLAAAVSGTVASVVTTPTDVIKTRMMLAADGAESGRAAPGTVEIGKQIYQKEGVRGLFRGGLLKAGWTALSLGLYLGIYEGGRLYLENRRKDSNKNSNKKDGNSVI